MNWYWMDRFTIFEAGKRAQAVKAITRAEEHLASHFPFHPIMPVSLAIEGMAQAAGLLVHESTNYKKKIVLGKIPRLKFSDVELAPGDLLVYDVVVDYINDEGSMLSVAVHKDGELIAEGALIFAHLGTDYDNQPLYGDEDLTDLVRAYGVYDIGVAADGSPIRDPALAK